MCSISQDHSPPWVTKARQALSRSSSGCLQSWPHSSAYHQPALEPLRPPLLPQLLQTADLI